MPKWRMGDHYRAIKCPTCKWPFHCPVEQYDTRIEYRACESKQ